MRDLVPHEKDEELKRRKEKSMKKNPVSFMLQKFKYILKVLSDLHEIGLLIFNLKAFILL